MGGNKGFKGIDKRPYQVSVGENSHGNASPGSHYLLRKGDRGEGLSPGYRTYDLKTTDWDRSGWSCSFAEGSGSLMFHSSDTNYATLWESRPAWSRPTLKMSNWTKREEVAKISFRVGNCWGGNSAGNFYGFFGLIDTTGIGRSGTTRGSEAGPIYSSGGAYRSTIGFGAYAAANKCYLYLQNNNMAGTMTVAQGDLIEATVDANGVLRFYQNGSIFITSPWNVKMESPQYGDFEYRIYLQSDRSGGAGKFGLYDWKMTGVINENNSIEDMFATQLTQTMLPISASTFGSASYSGVTLPTMASSATGSEVHFHGGSYTTPIWSEQFITGSGIGGIYMVSCPSSSAEMPLTQIGPAITRHDLNSGYQHYSQTFGLRTLADTWADGGSTWRMDNWYVWGATGGTSTANNHPFNQGILPITTGSMIAIIVTGSDANNVKLYGKQPTDFGTGAAPDSQIVYSFIKLQDPAGNPVNEYTSNNWMLLCINWYHGGTDYGKEAMKLLFNDGDTGRRFTNIRIGEQWFASGSV